MDWNWLVSTKTTAALFLPSTSPVPWETLGKAARGLDLFLESTRAATETAAVECPAPPPGCTFRGVVYTEHCYCVYDCEGGTLLIPCP
jgi:hypothetical protein